MVSRSPVTGVMVVQYGRRRTSGQEAYCRLRVRRHRSGAATLRITFFGNRPSKDIALPASVIDQLDAALFEVQS